MGKIKEYLELDNYNYLDESIKKYLVKKLIILPLLLFIIVFLLLSPVTRLAAFIVFLSSIVYSFGILNEYRMFVKGEIKKLTGKCVRIIKDDEQLRKVEHKVLKSNVLYGRCRIYIADNNDVYEVSFPGNRKIEIGDFVDVWIANNSFGFTRNDNVTVIHSPYIIETHIDIHG